MSLSATPGSRIMTLLALVSLPSLALSLPTTYDQPSAALQPRRLSSASSTYAYNQTAVLGNPWVGLVQFAPRTARKHVLADGSLSYIITEGSATPASRQFPRSMENFYLSFASLMSGWNSFTLGEFEQLLTQIAARGNQACCRIYVDYPGKTRYPTDGVPAFLVEGLVRAPHA